MTQIELRPYQLACIQAAQAEWKSGRLATFGHLATGTGKTELALGLLAEEMKDGSVGRVLFLVGSIKLAYQPIERIDKSWPEFQFKTGIVQGANNDVSARFIAAT